MNAVIDLNVSEKVHVNPDQLEGLYSTLGNVAAEDVVCRAMEELALRLAHCDRLYRSCEFSDLRKSSRSMIAIADQIGMTKLSRVANDVTLCIDSGDEIALAATFTRLIRTGEASLSAIWDLQDITL